MYNKYKNLNIASTLFLFCSVLFLACKKEVKPIELIIPERTIDSVAMKAYKANLSNRYAAIGYMYGWGTSDASILMHTPDSLDVIVLKNGYGNLSPAQVTDLNNTRSKKATKVLLGFDFNVGIVAPSDLTDTINNRQTRRRAELVASGATAALITTELAKVKTDAESWAKAIAINQYNNITLQASGLIQQYKFDGISIQLPVVSGYLQDAVNVFFQNLGADYGVGKQNILIVENPDTLYKASLAKANWLVYNKQTPDYNLSYFSNDASYFPNGKFVPSADYASETDADGYGDSQTFGPSGILPRTSDVVNWNGPNKGGAAFYHIEKNYTSIAGNITYTGLRLAINTLQHSQK